MPPVTLKRPAKTALAHVNQLARQHKAGALEAVAQVIAMSNVSAGQWAEARQQLLRHAPIALHFHPDRAANGFATVAQGLFEQGQYHSQFVSGCSNGLLAPTLDGPRAQWENRLFADAYQEEALQRPVYGAWHLLPHSDGPSPRFGSCYFLLAPAVSSRATFCFGDSHRLTDHRGTTAEPDAVLAALLTECFERDRVLGQNRSVPQLVQALSQPRDSRWLDAPPQGCLDHYIEAQVHGGVSLERDVTDLVADPSFIGTDVGNTLEALARRYRINLCWHGGYRLKADKVPDNRRGPLMPELAEWVSDLGQSEGQGAWVDAAHIGLALQHANKNPSAWRHWGETPPQLLKWLWHLLVMSAR
ncbi:DUF3626 domain-containing protein [Ferrimonas balearica]|uniref:DUF3626 domain-containing protein n=1 Tax=Ferrimonas balearica TaxID=44012 RepID=UPI001C9874EE|nr:DUF3626 domain-containing protein [Ferrimonas balearica]MBY6093157.1 DUF3626 domain-containing protein [Ferrimonas balearica]MBY6223048.1 DUF3626 domain-containing protein [Ferrimonas balearica]